MNLERAEAVARAVLYEGYLLYPYTSSAIKNRRRWDFGVLYPPAFDSSEMQTECLALAREDVRVEVRVRFLQCTSAGETIERELPVGPFSVTGEERIDGNVELAISRLDELINRISVRIRNLTSYEGSTRDAVLLRSMISTHTILTIHGAEFLSSIDPPDEFREAAAACRNIGTWPVLAGAQGERDVMLSSPVILYDYPQIAPESAGDLFDATEIDEILTLRILSLSEEEKTQIREGGARTRQILERSETLVPEQLLKLHGAWRRLKVER